MLSPKVQILNNERASPCLPWRDASECAESSGCVGTGMIVAEKSEFFTMKRGLARTDGNVDSYQIS